MGGKAFAPTLYTPRMPPPVYDVVLEETLIILRSQFFGDANSPIAAPEKPDHGDIDIVAAEPSDPKMTIEDISIALKAKDIKKTPNSSTTHFAIPWPEKFNASTTPPAHMTNDLNTVNDVDLPSPAKARYIQLDLNILPTRESFTYALFLHAHGDFWNIIGGTIRRYGLTISTGGLYLRIAEIEAHNRIQARILLTSNPTEILTFLGFDPDIFWTLFPTLDAMMDYAATCRFHDPTRYQSSTEHKQDLKANDRRREKKRSHFRYWIDDYLPLHREDGMVGEWATLTREQVVALANTHFDVADEYNTRKTTQLRIIGEAKLWADIRSALSDDENLEIGYVMKGLKREITATGLVDGVDDVKEESDLLRAQKAFVESRWDDVLGYALQYHRLIGARQKKIDMGQSRVQMLEKLMKEREREAQAQAAVGREGECESE